MNIKNAFSAFEFDADDATIDTLRSDIAYALREYIERSGKGQVKIGEELGLKQSVVSHIVRGDIEHLSVERLIRAMVKAKLPGFAEWGGTAEEARAGIGFRKDSPLSAVVLTPSFAVPGSDWGDAQAVNTGGKRSPQVVTGKSTASSRASGGGQ